MALGGIDLNLLVILQALLEESNVTRAGVRLGIPQPAMSNSLARLRRHYKDELLVRTGNGYELTPLARSLLPSVQESTKLLGHVFVPAQRQSPVGERTFTLCLSDYSVTILGEPLLRRVHELAPDVSVQLRLATPEITDPGRGLLGYDLLIAPAGFWPGGNPQEVCRDRFVYVADPANPRLRHGTLTLGDLRSLPHAVARLPQPGADPAGAELERLGVTPNVVVTTGGWLPLPFIVAGTDLVAAIPGRLARRVASAAGVIIVQPPFGAIELIEAAWWHPMRATDPALTWLRTIVQETAARLDDDTVAPADA
jgi:DNA-binding transcriptional LysR family regulator